MNKLISNLIRIFVLLLLVFGGQFFPAKAQYNVKTAGSGQANTSETFLPIAADNPSALTGPIKVFLPLMVKNYFAPAPLWRFGTGLARNPLSAYDSAGLVTMRFGWYVNFGVTANAPTPYGMEYVPTVRIKQLKLALDSTISTCCVSCNYVTPYDTAIPGENYTASPDLTQIPAIAQSHPGMTWLIGNEMDRIDSISSTFGSCNNQDEMLPELYAQVYHDYYAAIKTADPTAQVAIGAMVEFTPLRQQYLDRVWAEYSRLATLRGWTDTTMPVDVWNIHVYVLREEKDSWGADIPAGFDRNTPGMLYTIDDNKNFSLAWDQVLALRNWMKTNGQQDKPLIISEYGVLFPTWLNCNTYPVTTGCPFSEEQVRDSFMYPSFEKFLNYTDATLGYPADGNRLVQRWNWFSIDFDNVACDTGMSYQILGGNLFNSGLNSLCSPTDTQPPFGLSILGNYWKQYIQNLPTGSTKPYGP